LNAKRGRYEWIKTHWYINVDHYESSSGSIRAPSFDLLTARVQRGLCACFRLCVCVCVCESVCESVFQNVCVCVIIFEEWAGILQSSGSFLLLNPVFVHKKPWNVNVSLSLSLSLHRGQSHSRRRYDIQITHLLLDVFIFYNKHKKSTDIIVFHLLVLKTKRITSSEVKHEIVQSYFSLFECFLKSYTCIHWKTITFDVVTALFGSGYILYDPFVLKDKCNILNQ